MNSVHTLLCVTILKWVAQAGQHGRYNLSVYPTLSVQPVDNARNEIVKEFLKSDCTHLLFIDADTLPPEDVIDKLLAVKQPIVSGLTPIIEPGKDGLPWRKMNCVGMDDQLVKPNTGVVRVKGTGGSCLMIERFVFTQVKAPWFRFIYKDDQGRDTMVSEDIYFIIQAFGKGIPAYADTSVICKHYKSFLF